MKDSPAKRAIHPLEKPRLAHLTKAQQLDREETAELMQALAAASDRYGLFSST